ncbi:MAG TPA: TIGR00300 family protein, partial [Ktedonobacter sp.]|nr:TIGR00300 family protein [Ktedonobacter sp.]
MPSELVELSGHIIDSWTLPRAWDIIMDRGGNFVVEEMRVGIRKTEPSYARLKIEAPDDDILELILSELQQFGVVLMHGADAQTMAVEQNGVLPEKFYSTTNLPTQVRVNGQWVSVEGTEMDVAIVIDRIKSSAFSRPMHEVQVGDQVVIGHDGIRVQPFERARERDAFAFMQSSVSSEKVKV